MKRIALDLGEARIGVAACDEAGRLAFARGVLPRHGHTRDAAAIARLLRDEAAGEMVVGVPLRPDGSDSDRAAALRRTGERLAAELGVPVAFQDERHSTEEARESLRELGLDERRIRERVDAESARIILQRYLDRLPEPAR